MGDTNLQYTEASYLFSMSFVAQLEHPCYVGGRDTATGGYQSNHGNYGNHYYLPSFCTCTAAVSVVLLLHPLITSRLSPAHFLLAVSFE